MLVRLIRRKALLKFQAVSVTRGSRSDVVPSLIAEVRKKLISFAHSWL